MSISDGKALKTMVFNIEKSLKSGIVLIANTAGEKVQLMLRINETLVENGDLDASAIIRQLAKHINGGGGGQKFFATAGGSKADGIEAAFLEMRSLLQA